MYSRYFGLTEAPFSIAPNPRYLYMSERHREALAHLLYGVSGSGGFVLLTGEVGTGKTTISRSLLQKLPDDTDVAFILNPYQTTIELLATICDELGVSYIADEPTAKELSDVLHHYLLNNHGKGRNTVLMIDEAQLLPFETLEQIRLLTNLETDNKKLLQIILIGQPELKQVLLRPELSQLAQRITARFHIDVMREEEVQHYIEHRLKVAGGDENTQLFPAKVCREIYQLSGGVPRLINVLCDRALLGAYTQHKLVVDLATLKRAAKEALGEERPARVSASWQWSVPWLAVVALSLLTVVLVGERWTAFNAHRGELSDTSLSSASVAPVTPRVTAAELTQHEVEPTGEQAQSSGRKADSIAPETVSVWRPGMEPALNSLLKYIGLDNDHRVVDCASLETLGLACREKSVTRWSAITELNRPMILRRQDSESYAVLVGLDGAQATLWIDGKRVQQSLMDLGEYWSGETIIVWHRPLSYQSSIGIGERGAMVSWLATTFATIDQQPQALTDDYFNRALELRVELFQRRHGLHDDGVVGVNTLLQLNEKLYPTRLLNERVEVLPELTGHAVVVTPSPSEEG